MIVIIHLYLRHSVWCVDGAVSSTIPGIFPLRTPVSSLTSHHNQCEGLKENRWGGRSESWDEQTKQDICEWWIPNQYQPIRNGRQKVSDLAEGPPRSIPERLDRGRCPASPSLKGLAKYFDVFRSWRSKKSTMYGYFSWTSKGFGDLQFPDNYSFFVNRLWYCAKAKSKRR